VVSAILVLWDIDHTLIENHGVNKEAFGRELAQLRADVRAVNTLTVELQETRAELTALGNVTRLDGRRVPARHEGER
jgi:hypothetical protein